jgi:NADH-quinone oxidoreductase subunit J
VTGLLLAHHLTVALAAASKPLTKTSTGEAVAFFTLGPLALLAALGLVMAKNAVHAALLLVVVMFSLAVFYVMNQAPFLGAVEIIVYAGAIMILFLFVLMLIGVDSSDSLVETLRGQRVAAVVLSLGIAGLLAAGIGHAMSGAVYTGLGKANGDHNGNVPGIARLLFTTYVFPFEVVSALLIVAAIGAMVLAHRERVGPKVTQRELMKLRVRGSRLSPRSGPGVYAVHDDAAQRAMLPDGTPDEQDVLPEFAGGTGSTGGTGSGAG